MDAKPAEIIVKNVTKTFHQGDTAIHALRSVNFEVRAGHLQMIVGPSGSGKTTLLSVIAGVLFFEDGEVEIMGHSLHQMTEDEITEFRKKTIGFIFQMYNLIPTLTCLENVMIPLLLNGVAQRTAKASARHYLDKVGLLHREEEFPTHLSGGSCSALPLRGPWCMSRRLLSAMNQRLLWMLRRGLKLWNCSMSWSKAKTGA